MTTIKICEACGARFQAATKRALYCSNACRQKQYRQRSNRVVGGRIGRARIIAEHVEWRDESRMSVMQFAPWAPARSSKMRFGRDKSKKGLELHYIERKVRQDLARRDLIPREGSPPISDTRILPRDRSGPHPDRNYDHYFVDGDTSIPDEAMRLLARRILIAVGRLRAPGWSAATGDHM